jgi:hypothetical protein
VSPSGIFLQVLEGGRSAVNRCTAASPPTRGTREVELLSYEEIGERRFAGWAMGQVDMARLNPALLLKYSEKPTLDPYAVSGAVSMALFEELMATASIVGTEWGNVAVSSVQYSHGMLSCSEFTGVLLSTLLEMCGYDKKNAKVVLAEGPTVRP